MLEIVNFDTTIDPSKDVGGIGTERNVAMGKTDVQIFMDAAAHRIPGVISDEERLAERIRLASAPVAGDEVFHYENLHGN